MKTKIAVVTVSGKAYYKLVNELKRRDLLFLSLIPGEPIPTYVKVAITTEKEQSLINHPRILIFDAETEPTSILDEAIRIIEEKEICEKLVVGVDPGKTFGVAILCDGKVLRTQDCSSLEETIDIILTALKMNPAKVQIVRIGIGIPSLADELLRRLSGSLPEHTQVEMVSESGTSRFRREDGRKKLSDADSAVKIAEKRGRVQPRGKLDET